ncbi:MAG: hypothetical protein EXR72_01355 [Myxococcales bacterium]|nr:hypothetical protein [Myxococcales bacterium]
MLVALCALLARARGSSGDPFRVIPRLFVVVGVFVLLLRVANYAIVPYSHTTHLIPTHLRIDGLLFGVALCYGWTYHRASVEARLHRRGALLAASIALLLPSLLLDIERDWAVSTVGLTLNYLGFGGILLLAISAPPSSGTLRRHLVAVVARIGFYSYSIYLWHLLMLVFAEMVRRHLGDVATLGLYLLLSVAGGMVLGRVIEGPFLALRDRLFPSRSGVD